MSENNLSGVGTCVLFKRIRKKRMIVIRNLINQEHVKPSGHSAQPVEAPILDHTPKPTSSKTNVSRKRKNKKTCFVCRGVDYLIKDCTFHAKPKTQPTPRNYAHKGYDKQYASSTKKYPQNHRVPPAVFTKSKPVSVTAARPVSAAVPKIMAAMPRHALVSAAKGKKGKWVWKPKHHILDHDSSASKPKPDLVFNTAPLVVESDHSAFNVQLSPVKPA
nr:hypothetical protein [Tanacetum cinerariifolium]